MIKDYVIIYEEKVYYGRYFDSSIHKIQIPALTLFDAVEYAHNTLKLENIKEVRVS